MKSTRLAPMLAAALLACGGEPTPTTPTTAPSASASPSASAAAVTSAAPTDTAAPSASAAASAAPSASAATATPPPAAKGSISGTITSTPAAAAKNGVVYLEDGPTDKPANGRIDNKQMNFIPYVDVVSVGGTVTFANSDPFPHNVFSPDNEKWDIGQIAQNGSKTRKFDKPGAYTLLCNLHPNMKGYVLVVPGSMFAKADAKGAFQMKDVPAGTYKVTAWAPGTKPQTVSVTVSGDATQNFDLHR